MRITSVGSGQRGAYYDRNPTAQQNSTFLNNFAPHGTTTRWTYTVPTGRKAFMTQVLAQILRLVVATTPATPLTQITYTPSGGAQVSFNNAKLSTANTLGDRATTGPSSGLALLAGDNIACNTSDGSTTGSCDYLGVGAAIEYDA